jgi:hypothetical protein
VTSTELALLFGTIYLAPHVPSWLGLLIALSLIGASSFFRG